MYCSLLILIAAFVWLIVSCCSAVSVSIFSKIEKNKSVFGDNNGSKIGEKPETTANKCCHSSVDLLSYNRP